MASEKASSWDRRIEQVRNAGDKALRRILMRQAEAAARYGTELSKFAAGKRSAPAAVGSLIQLAADEGVRYTEEVYLAAVDYYKAVFAFYRAPLGSAGESNAPMRTAKQPRHTAKRPRHTATRSRTRAHTRASA